MDVKFVSLPAIDIIGREGLCTKGHNIVSELWAEANAHFAEVAPLGMKEKDGPYAGAFVGFWGAMSDVSRQFLPWTDDFLTGLYLAGIEVVHEQEAPEGWTKWTLPARRYLVADVTPETYGEIFREVIESVIPAKGLRLSGAVCDYTEPATGQNRLFFPVESLEAIGEEDDE